jgi:putative transposase
VQAVGMAESGERKAFPQRLHHAVPAWVGTGAYFHIRLRAAQGNLRSLIDPEIGCSLLNSARRYHEAGRWHCMIFLLMPDHAHALVAFPLESRFSRVVGEWKHYTALNPGIRWQANFFDHRIRNPAGLAQKYDYILRNPVVKGLCVSAHDWPWKWQPL